MSLKMKLISAISAFTLVLGLLIMGVFAVNQAQVDMGGSITFNADDVYARVTGSVANAQVAPASLDVTYSAYDTVGDLSAWEELDLLFDSQGTPIVITITVENLSTERSLTVNLTDTISSSTPNLNKSLQRDSSTYSSGTNITLDPKNGTSTTTFTITLSVADRNQSLNNTQFDYDLNLYDESAVPEPPEVYSGFEFNILENNTAEVSSYTGTDTEVIIPSTFSIDTTPITSFTINEDGTSSIPGDPTGEFAMYALYLGGFYYTPQGGERTYCANIMEFENIVASLTFPVYFEPQCTLSLGEYSEENLQMFQMYIMGLMKLQENGYSDGNFYFTTADGQYNNTLVNAVDIYNSLSSVQDPTELQSMFPMQLNLASTFGAPVYIEGDDYTVVGLADGGAWYAGAGNDDYTGAFSESPNVNTIYIPKTVRYIGDYTFAISYSLHEDSKLTKVVFEEDSQLERIGIRAFTRCASLNEIELPSSLTSIGGNAFGGCTSLQPTITDEQNVEYIGNSDNPYLILFNGQGITTTTYTVNSNCKIIYSSAFLRCSGLTSISLPSSLTSIGDSAFANCSGLTGITLPDGLTSIRERTFFGCSGLTNITLPSSLTSIGNYAFSYCSNLTEVIIDSEYVYTNATSASECGDLLENATTIKVLTSLVISNHRYINTTNFPNISNEEIGEKNYTVYSK